MADIKQLIVPLVTGIAAISVIDIFGSITSRRLNYNYAYLTPLAIFAYATVGYMTIQIANLTMAICIAWLVGIYDATLGWHYAIILKANRYDPDEAKKSTVTSRLVMILIFSGFFAFVGSKLAMMVQ